MDTLTWQSQRKAIAEHVNHRYPLALPVAYKGYRNLDFGRANLCFGRICTPSAPVASASVGYGP